MSSHAVANSDGLLEGQSVDEWVLENLRWHGAQTLDHLNAVFPKLEEARLLFAIDRLSRAGKVVISPPKDGDYLISARSAEELAAGQDKDRLFKEAQESGQSPVG